MIKVDNCARAAREQRQDRERVLVCLLASLARYTHSWGPARREGALCKSGERAEAELPCTHEIAHPTTAHTKHTLHTRNCTHKHTHTNTPCTHEIAHTNTLLNTRSFAHTNTPIFDAV